MIKNNYNKNQSPLVSVITAVYNIKKAAREKYLIQNLESVRGQDYKNIEHIFIDGGSTDGTLALLNKYKNNGWIKVYSGPDSGIYDAMNKGAGKAKGKYISFLNTDDFYHKKDGIKKTIERLEESGADFSYAPAKIINENGLVLRYHYHSFPEIWQTFSRMPFCHQTMFIKRDVFIKEGMFDTTYKSAGDYEFILRLALKKIKPIYVIDKFVTYRTGGVSDLRQKLSRFEAGRAYKSLFSDICKASDDEYKKIYSNPQSYITENLLEILKNYYPYFDSEKFYKWQLREARDEIEGLKKSLKKAAKEKEEIYNSKGWRIIKNIRKTINTIKGKR